MTTSQEADKPAALHGLTLSADKIELTDGKCKRDVENVLLNV